ncbi:hypothetical protein CYMTET_44144 [Cymbomonas tetramitiformis]|uniref:Uncharacterized protein n=1 Tax=Cymbomonas tetramitiformis TaxID=36881 RepID=A0AAE0C2Q6_9CHLO|nr:hypothetical protein CYMTET_44144 [Cymbomonas tetramitiformis]
MSDDHANNPTGYGTGNGYRFFRFRMIGDAPWVGFSNFKLVKAGGACGHLEASSITGGTFADCGPSSAVDDDPDTYWIDPNGLPLYLSSDVYLNPESYSFQTSTERCPESDAEISWVLEASTDGVDYNVRLHGESKQVVTMGGQHGPFYIQSREVSERRPSTAGNAAGSSDGYRFFRFRMINDPVAASPWVGFSNFKLAGADEEAYLEASNPGGKTSPNFGPSSAVDDDPDTYWIDTNGLPLYLSSDVYLNPESYSFQTSTRRCPESEAEISWVLEASTDGVDYNVRLHGESKQVVTMGGPQGPFDIQPREASARRTTFEVIGNNLWDAASNLSGTVDPYTDQYVRRLRVSDVCSGMLTGWLACALLAIGVILILILIPMSFQYVHYHEYALLQSRTTGEVFTEKVYAVRGLSPPLGRLLGGPAPLYLYYRAAGLLGGS